MPRPLSLTLLAAASMCDAYQRPCSELTNVKSQAACEVNNRAGKQERHRARMAKCSFQPEPMIELQFLAQGADLDHLHYIVNSSIDAQTCEVSEGNGVWHFTRIGPFVTEGGKDWTSVITNHDPRMHSQWRATSLGGVALYVGDHVVGSSDARGELIGYPPIHQHHWHYGDASEIKRLRFSAHGDQQCLNGQGVYCLLVEYPGDVAFEVFPHLRIFAEFNDVRKSGSPPLSWYALGGIFIHAPASSKPKAMNWATLAMNPLNLPLGHSETRMYDTTLASVMWITGTIPGMDYVVDSYFHAHGEMVDDIWLIAGSPAQLGLLSPPWIFAFTRTLSGDSVIPQLKSHLHQTMGASGASLLCNYGELQHTEVVQGYAQGLYTRRATCSFARGHRGDIKWTMVGFYKAQVADLPRFYGMHTDVRVAYVATSGTPTYAAGNCSGRPLEKPTPEWRASDVAPSDMVRSMGGYRCLWAYIHADGLSWVLAPDANSPNLNYIFWSSPWLLSLFALVLTLWCCRRCRISKACSTAYCCESPRALSQLL